jgi:hypothetical protein
MVGFANGFGIAVLLTAAFALRFRYWDNPKVLAVYFAAFFAIEIVAGHFFIPDGAMGIEIALVCLGLTVPILGVIEFFRRHEHEMDEAE